MINLKSATTDKLRASLSAAQHVFFEVEFIDSDATMLTTSSATPDRELQDKNTIATHDICATPGTGTYNPCVRNVKSIHAYADVANNVQVIYSNNGTEYKIGPLFVLLAGESFSLNGDGVWFHYDSNGGVYSVGQTFAVQADMETGTSTTLVVSPGMMKYHPGSVKAWVSCGVAGDVQQSYNIGSVADTGTGVATPAFSTNQSATTFCVICNCENILTTYSVSSIRNCRLRSATRAVSGFAMECTDQTASLSLVKDPTTYHAVVMGDL